MENRNNDGRRWTPDQAEGSIIAAIILARKPTRLSDPRYDVVIDMGVLLNGSDRVLFETDRIEITRAESQVYVLYTVKHDDGLVFDVMFTADGIVWGEFIDGYWRAVMSTFVKQLRRKRLLTGVA